MAKKEKKASVFLPMKLANDLIAKRTKDNLSFNDTVIATGIEKTALYRAEIGDIPKLESFARMCKWLGKPMDNYITFKTSGK